MGVLIKKQRGMPIFTGMAKLSVVTFLASLSASLIDTIWAIYLDSFFHSEVIVGLISSALTFIAFLAFFVFVPFVEKNNKSKIFAYTLFLFGISYLLFSINTNFYFFLFLAIVITLLQTLRITTLGLIIKDKSNENKLSRNEGLMYTFMNTAWVIGPLIGGYILNHYHVKFVFILSAFISLIAFSLFQLYGIKTKISSRKSHDRVFKNFFEFFKNKDRLYAYAIHGGVAVWWVLVYLFLPLQIIRSNLGTVAVGYFLVAVAIHLILMEYTFSKLAGKIGFRKLFKMGFLFVSVISFICFFVNSLSIILILVVIASFGMAMLEPTSEAYFFDVLKDHQATRFYGPYNTTIDVNQFTIKLLASLLLIFLPFKYLFILFGTVMFIFFLISFKIRNVIESRKR